MQITLNEYTLALLCGGISCITYLVTAALPRDAKAVRINDANEKKRARKPILKSNHSETNDSFDEELDDEDDQNSGSERQLSRRQSYNRVKQRRSESIIKSEHVIFADEITADNEKFSPAHNEIPDELVEGILSKSEEDGQLAVNLNLTEVEALNHFETIHPLDDHDLLMRRRSLHSTPSGSHRGSKSNLANDSDHNDDQGFESKSGDDRQILAKLYSYKERVSTLESELSEMETLNAQEKHELEKTLNEAGLGSSDLSGSVKELHTLLLTALGQLYPEMKQRDEDVKLLDCYVEKLSKQH